MADAERGEHALEAVGGRLGACVVADGDREVVDAGWGAGGMRNCAQLG